VPANCGSGGLPRSIGTPTQGDKKLAREVAKPNTIVPKARPGCGQQYHSCAPTDCGFEPALDERNVALPTNKSDASVQRYLLTHRLLRFVCRWWDVVRYHGTLLQRIHPEKVALACATMRPERHLPSLY